MTLLWVQNDDRTFPLIQNTKNIVDYSATRIVGDSGWEKIKKKNWY